MSGARELLARLRRRRGPVHEPEEPNVKPLPIMHDPLKAIGTQLVIAAHRLREEELERERVAGVRRRRRARARPASALGATAIALLALSVGAPAVGWNLSALDDAVETLVSGLRDERTGVPAPQTWIPPEDVAAPRRGGASRSETLVIPWAVGGDSAHVTAYINTRDQVCIAGDAPSEVGVAGATSLFLGGCRTAAALRLGMQGAVAEAVGVRTGTVMMVYGFADPGVVAIDVARPSEGFATQLAETWRPDLDGGAPFRLFVAYVHEPMYASAARAARLTDLRRYVLRARLVNGEIREVPAQNQRET